MLWVLDKKSKLTTAFHDLPTNYSGNREIACNGYPVLPWRSEHKFPTLSRNAALHQPASL
jgi:hypothetical protein